MTTYTMPLLREMYDVERYNSQRNYYFFYPETKRFFNSRIQTSPPYCGRVFVTSERMNWNSPRLYSVRVIHPSGSIETVGTFQGFTTRKSAHDYAKAYANENYVVFGNKSIEIPMETEIV